MKISIRKGFGFGLTSGIITTLGMVVGLDSGTHMKAVVLGGIFIIAIADALSDALGMHISEEYEAKHSRTEIWESTFATFFTKLIVALTFVVPVLLLELSTAIMASIIWGLSLIIIFSYFIAKQEKANPFPVVSEHLVIAVAVVIITHFVGDLVAMLV